MSEETKKIIEMVNRGELPPLKETDGEQFGLRMLKPNEEKQKARPQEIVFKIATVLSLIAAVIFLSVARTEAMDKAAEQAALIREHKENEERLTNELLTVTEQKTELENGIFAEKMQKEELQDRFEGLQAEIEDLQTIIKNQAETIEEQERTIAIHTDTDPIPYTQEDIDILAAVMYGEEYPNRYEMMLAGSVVLNRVKDPQFPDTIKAVVYQFDGQYEQYAPRTKGFVGKDLPEECYRLAEILLRYGSIAPGEVIYQAHFNQGDVFWSWQGEEFCFGR